MLRTSLKRSSNVYTMMHRQLNDTAETMSVNRSFEGESLNPLNTFAGREYQLLDAALRPHLEEETKFKTKHVPMCLVNSPLSIFEQRHPTTTSLIVSDQSLPAEVDKIMKNNSPMNMNRMGHGGSLCWMINGAELILWSTDDETVQFRQNFDKVILAIAFGRLDGATAPNGTSMQIFAIAFEHVIALYNYSSIGMLEDLNINISTNNELVNCVLVQPQGVYFGGSEGTMKLVRCNSNRWYSQDSEPFAWLKCPLLVDMFMERLIIQSFTSATRSVLFTLVQKQYNDHWLSRKLLWKNELPTEMEICSYIVTEGTIKLFNKVQEHKLIAKLREDYTSLKGVPIDQLRIQGIYQAEANSIGVCLAGGIYLEITNPITLELSRPILYLNPPPTVKLYDNIQGRACENIAGNMMQVPIVPRAGYVTQSLGLDNITVFREPTQLAFISNENIDISVWLPNKPGNPDEQREPGSIFLEQPNHKGRQVSANGQLIELEQQLFGMKISNNFKKSIFAPVRQWLYVEHQSVKVIKKLRLLDLTMVLLKVHYQIASKENLKTPQLIALDQSLGHFIGTYGLINFCECLLEIVLNRLIKVTIPEIDYHNTLMASMGIPLNQQKAPPLKGFKTIENTPDIKMFAEKLLARLSREVKKPKPINSMYYSNLMEKVQDDAECVTADTLWHVLLKYYHTLFEEVRNKPIYYFGRERRFCCFIREKMEMLRRFLLKKYEELESFNLDQVSRPELLRKGFESMLNSVAIDQQPKPLINFDEELRFGQESTKTLIFYMISTLKKIQTLMEIFEKFNIQGSIVTIKLCLTNTQVAQTVRDLILGYYKLGDPYIESLLTAIPEVLSFPHIIFHTWEQKTDAEQMKIDLREAICSLNIDQLNKVVTRLRTAENGLQRITDLLIHRLEKIDEELLFAKPRELSPVIRDSITSSISNLEVETKETRRQQTLECLNSFIQSFIAQVKKSANTEEIQSLASMLRKFRKYVDRAKYIERTRIYPENERTAVAIVGKVDSMFTKLLQRQDLFIPGIQKYYKREENVGRDDNYDNFIGRAAIARRIAPVLIPL